MGDGLSNPYSPKGPCQNKKKTVACRLDGSSLAAHKKSFLIFRLKKVATTTRSISTTTTTTATEICRRNMQKTLELKAALCGPRTRSFQKSKSYTRVYGFGGFCAIYPVAQGMSTYKQNLAPCQLEWRFSIFCH